MRELCNFRLSTTEQRELAELAQQLGTSNKAAALRSAVRIAMQSITLVRAETAQNITKTLDALHV